MRIRIGSRGSALAMWQAEHVRTQLTSRGHEVEIQLIVTTGDRVLDRRLDNVGGKGAFLKEIEEAMLRGEVDLAVHSLKDVPVVLPDGLRLCAMLERADPRDAFLSRSKKRFRALPNGARLGTTSLRRSTQLLTMRPDLAIEDLRGNVDTRIRKLKEGEYDAIVLAMAGLTRLGRLGEVTEVFEPEILLPAPGQGAIALECRTDDGALFEAAAALDHPPTGRAVLAERAFLRGLGGGCNVPLGAFARVDGSELHLAAFVAGRIGGPLLRGERRGRDPEEVGRALADELKARGAIDLMHP
jgi:hydroxymethylbilane synthase